MIQPDRSLRLNIQHEDGEHSFLLDPVFNRIDRFEWLGFNLLKIIDPEMGFVQLPIEDDHVVHIHNEIMLPLVERDFITVNEYDIYLRLQEQFMEGWIE